MSRAGVRAAMYLDRWTIEIRVTHHTDTQTERERESCSVRVSYGLTATAHCTSTG